MKKVVQLTLFLILIIITIIFYKIYFSDKKEDQKIEAIINKNQNSQNNIDSKNNLIKNLKYEIKLNTENQYIITSDLSEISYENNNSSFWKDLDPQGFERCNFTFLECSIDASPK